VKREAALDSLFRASRVSHFALHASSAFAILAAALLAAGCVSEADSHSMAGPPAVTVEMYTVEPRTIQDIVDLVGALEAEESVVIRPETGGIIESVAFEEGHEVAAGALLFRLRDAEERARLNEAQARLVLAEEEFRRATVLAGKNALSQAELDRAKAERQVAEAQRNRREVELKRTEIRAPFKGVLGARLVSPGERIDPDTDLVRLDAVDHLRLIFSLPEIALALARVGLKLDLWVVPFPGEQFNGEVYFVAPALEPRNRRLLVKATVPNPEHRLRPGMFANIRVEIARKDNALAVPEAAIAYDASGAFVWRVGSDNVAQRAAVKTGIRRDKHVEIVEGIAAGDRIVSGGTHKVIPGTALSEASPAGTAAGNEEPAG
jgi:membrane fusion protein (multidrug efflux system)